MPLPQQNPTYKNPQAGVPLMTTISSGCKSPILRIKYSNLLHPFYYPNSPKIPRYSVTCLADPEKDKEFLEGIRTIEKNEGVDSIIKNDAVKKDDEYVTSGLLVIKFQSKDQIPVYLHSNDTTPQLIALEDELAKNEQVIITFDILRYTKKSNVGVDHGISFRPSAIYYIPDGQ